MVSIKSSKKYPLSIPNRISKLSVLIWATIYYHFCSALCGLCVAATYKSNDISLQFGAQSKLKVLTAISRLFGVVSLERSLVVTFHVDYVAVNINGDGFALASFLAAF